MEGIGSIAVAAAGVVAVVMLVGWAIKKYSPRS